MLIWFLCFLFATVLTCEAHPLWHTCARSGALALIWIVVHFKDDMEDPYTLFLLLLTIPIAALGEGFVETVYGFLGFTAFAWTLILVIGGIVCSIPYINRAADFCILKTLPILAKKIC